MSAKFYPKPAHFESKTQSIPNNLIFSKVLTDREIRLLLAINAMKTYGGNWTPQQQDLRKRLGWGEEKMACAIKVCCKHGFMKVRQIRDSVSKKKGRYLSNEFEYCLDGSFKDTCDEKNPENAEKNPSHNEYEPTGYFPGSANPGSANQGLLCSCLDKQIGKDIKEQQQPEEILGENEEVVVVVPSISKKEEKANRKLLEPFGFDEKALSILCDFPTERIEVALIALKRAEGMNPLPSRNGWLRSAIIGGWKPNVTKQDLARQAEEKKIQEREKIHDVRKQCVALYHLYEPRFTPQFNFICYDHWFTATTKVHLSGSKISSSARYDDDDCIKNLKAYIENYVGK